MSASEQITIQINLENESIVERAIVAELRAGKSVESAARILRVKEATIRRRMGALLIRLLSEPEKLRRPEAHEAGADCVSDPPPPGGE
jgi:hypothetical protein